MRRFIETAIRNRRITLFSIILALIFGIYSYYVTPKQESPDISVTVAMLTTVYPGASAEEVERLVTRKIEDKVMEVDGFMEVTSNSRNNVSIVVLELQSGTKVDNAWNQLRQKMDALQSDLPGGCEKIDINTDLYQTAGMILSLSGADYSYEELAEFAENLKSELIDIDGITRIEINGKQEMEVCVEVNTEKLNGLPLSLEEITGRIQSQSLEIPAGALKNENTKMNVTLGGDFASIAEIENIVLLTSPENGSVVRLRDIARVSYELQDSSYKVKRNGENAVLLSGYFRGNRNIVFIGKEIDERLSSFIQELPAGVTAEKVLYQPEDVENAVNEFILNLIEGIALIIIVVFLGMGFRNALIVSAIIPISMLLTFIEMRIFGIYIHQISIAALIIALGMLDDNAIVVSDAIQERIDRGEEKLKACVEGAREVAIPVLTSTLTTVGAFVPFLLLEGMAGEFIRSVPQIIILTLSSSYLVAMFVSPVMAYLFFKPSKKIEKNKGYRLFFENLLIRALKKKKLTITTILALLVLSVWLVSLLGLQFFPKADTDMIVMDIEHEHGNDIEQTEELTKQVTDILNRQPEVTAHTFSIGDGLPKLYYSMSPPMKAQNYAQAMFTVDLGKGGRYKTSEAFSDFLQGVLDSELAQGTATIKLLEQGEPIGSPVRIRVVGEKAQLGQASEQIQAILREINGTINIKDDYTDSTYAYRVDTDSNSALRMGVSQYDLQKELNIALMGTNAGTISPDGQDGEGSIAGRSLQTPVRVVSDIENVDQLKNLAVKSSVTGNKILLTQVSEIGLEPGVSIIRRYDRVPAVTIYSDVEQGYSSVDIQRQVEEKLETTELGEVKVVFDGEREAILKYFANIGVLTIVAVFIIFMILLIQFGSFSQPFVIMLTIPLSAIGSIIGLYVFKQPLSFTSLLGIVSLFGIVVNNAIVLLDYINAERAEGKEIEQACVDTLKKRVRPIVLSNLTTLIGLFPLIASGSNLFAPMSIALASGLAVSTFLTLVIVPVVYTIMEKRIKRHSKRLSA